jgi:hypothetical protein
MSRAFSPWNLRDEVPGPLAQAVMGRAVGAVGRGRGFVEASDVTRDEGMSRDWRFQDLKFQKRTGRAQPGAGRLRKRVGLSRNDVIERAPEGGVRRLETK